MPYSSHIFDQLLVDQILALQPKKVLDVGAGAGKNGLLLKQAGYHRRLDAIEPTEDYIKKFNLADLYDKIYHQSLEEYVQKNPTNRYDVVICGDVLEHLFRSDAMDYLDYLLYRTRWVIVVWPTYMPQDDYENNHYEVHKSNFKLQDLAQKFNVQYFVSQHAYDNEEPGSMGARLNYCVIKGYMVSQRENIEWKTT